MGKDGRVKANLLLVVAIPLAVVGCGKSATPSATTGSGPSERAVLAQLSDSDAVVRANAAWTAGGLPPGDGALRKALEKLLAEDRVRAVRCMAARGLGRTGKAAEPPLLDLWAAAVPRSNFSVRFRASCLESPITPWSKPSHFSSTAMP